MVLDTNLEYTSLEICEAVRKWKSYIHIFTPFGIGG